jgi:hypothetical protein
MKVFFQMVTVILSKQPYLPISYGAAGAFLKFPFKLGMLGSIGHKN